MQRQACDERRKEQWNERKERGQLRAASVPTEPSTEFICNNGNRACRSRIGLYSTAGAAAQPLTKPWRRFHCLPRQTDEEPTVNFKNQPNLQISLLSTSKYLTKLKLAHGNHDFARSKTWLFVFVVIFFAQTASVVYNDTYIRYRSLYEPTLWKRCFRNQRYYSDGTSKLLGQSFAYRTQKSMWLRNSNFLKRINITALYYNVTDFLQVVLSPDQIVISNTSLLAQVQ